MKVMLQKDIKDLGKVGELVNVSPGYARNFLFPRRLALIATEGKVKEWSHLQKLSEIKMKKAHADREKLVAEITGKSVSFKMQASEEDKLFGSITALEISKELSKIGFEIDKKDIILEEPIKMLGQYKAEIKLGENLKGEISVIVEKI